MHRQVKIGDEVFIFVRGRGGHGAYIVVEKVNKKTFSGTERQRSYQPGRVWRIHKDCSFAFVNYVNGYMRLEWVNQETT